MKKRIELLLLEIVVRIAKHWRCDIHVSHTKTKLGGVKWIKLVFPEDTKL